MLKVCPKCKHLLETDVRHHCPDSDYSAWRDRLIADVADYEEGCNREETREDTDDV